MTKFGFTAWSTLLALLVVLVLGADNNNHKSLRADPRHLQTTSYCGCNDCDDSVWNLPVTDYGGDYTCGERIEWFQGNFGVSDIEACTALASNEFPAECGKACNPRRCDGRNVPYQVQNDPPIISGDLSPTDSLYCFPPYAQRQRYTNVWNNNFIMEVKETTAPMAVCGPGDNLFVPDTVSFQNNELKLEFKQEPVTGKWTGGEVRLVLPNSGIFQYGTYEWSVKSIQIIDTADGSVVSQTLPPRIVLGLFTWDTTETFGEKEKNNEVDIEISNFGDVGGPDVNFLVQPPGKPQQAKLYSGGGTSYDQGGHRYKFDWAPSGISWYSDAAGGLSHEYTNDIITDLFSPPWLQCLPADIEIRMNLWSLDGTNTQVGLEDGQKIEVVIDNFTYTPSGETHVADGGACSKHCHCSPDSTCDEGICQPVATATTTSTTATEVSYAATCSSHPDCVGLAGDCCPTPIGVFLYCCENYVEQAPPPPVNNAPACAAHEDCRSLAGDCCPTTTGAFLYCCDNYQP